MPNDRGEVTAPSTASTPALGAHSGPCVCHSVSEGRRCQAPGVTYMALCAHEHLRSGYVCAECIGKTSHGCKSCYEYDGHICRITLWPADGFPYSAD